MQFFARLKSATRILLKGDPKNKHRNPIPAITDEEVAEIKQFFPREKFFIFGHARSGTTLLMRLVRLHPDVHCNYQAHFFTRKPLLKSLVDSPEVEEWLTRKSNRWNHGRDLSPLVLRAAADFIMERDAAREGKMIATGGMEIGMMEWPFWTGTLRLAQFEERIKSPMDFLELPTDRWMHQEYSPPLLFRTMTTNWGCIGRIGLDFWDAGKVRSAPRSTSFFSHVEALTVPGPDGPAPTVRFQMLREGVQDAEVKTAIVRSYLKLPEEARKPYRALLDELQMRMGWGHPFYLSQCELVFDWPAYVARLHLAAAELAGEKTEATWDNPPR